MGALRFFVDVRALESGHASQTLPIAEGCICAYELHPVVGILLMTVFLFHSL